MYDEIHGINLMHLESINPNKTKHYHNKKKNSSYTV